ncbi:Lantibiotic dehydratase, C terminus [Chryseobacterium oranimense]|uniref:Lantibiotic dehydratase, C terminus n=1 Tax=Chryseobacterium oranimense TaxID=421058 RepID=A0A1M5X403_9FLAO|nr:lantibiotic dehydratase family protein [Chryseobacterium oranimense]SHH94244.1 Lantibiotic dehydratase, C terminus [Chryseobacterium oranimense]
MSRFPYQFFDEYVVRTPLFSYKKFQETIDKAEPQEEFLKQICENSIFQEAIYLASPYLYSELENWLSGKEVYSKGLEKLKNTLLKYYSRISTRCTPFGLFSGVSLGKFAGKTSNQSGSDSINNQINTDNYHRDTKLDMHYLVGLSQHFVTIPEIRNRLLFFPNNSIYRAGNKIRYVEYQYTNGKRDYIISSAPLSEELKHILYFSKSGKTIEQLAALLINTEITAEDAAEFVDELIDNQVLMSELDPNVSGTDFLRIIASVLNKIEAVNEAETLFSIQKRLEKLDRNIGNPISEYVKIEELAKSFGTTYEQKYLVQTDLYDENKFILSPHWKKELKKGISFLNKLTIYNEETHLEKFKKIFRERFETQEIPLSLALDTEMGIGYRQGIPAEGLHPYLEDLQLPNSQKKQATIQLSQIHKILNEKLQEALLENHHIIELFDEDFKDFKESWQDVPDTISFMTEIISENNREKLCIESTSGSTAANLLGRFCSENSEVQKLTKTITQKEKELNENYILAEIIHLPEARIGNVIRRSTLRDYEIPYLAQSVLPEDNQILIEDLYISLKNNRIVLWSKKLNKEIKPYLTNAHNYSINTLPVYHFLSDLHSQNVRTGLYFDWGGLSKIYHFLPRVEYKNIIISKARWKITEKEILQFSSSINHKEQFLIEFRNWRNKRCIPKWIQWVKSDNKLTVNLENYDLVKMFIDAIKNQAYVLIEEFLWNENDDYKREFIFPMYKDKK